MIGFFKLFFGKIIFFCAAFSIQALFFVMLFFPIPEKYKFAGVLFYFLTVFFLLIFIFCNEKNASYKLSLILPSLFAPFLFVFFYFQIGRKPLPVRLRKKLLQIQKSYASSSNTLSVPNPALDIFQLKTHSLLQSCGFNAANSEKSEFLCSGWAFKESLLGSIKKAKNSVYLEFYKINSGLFLNELLTPLLEKARSGVDVRITYDKLGSLKLKGKDLKAMRASGIRVQAFNPVAFSSNINARNHNKIAVIDMTTAYIGGINIDDDYINVTHRFGYWRDSAMKICGDAAKMLHIMFLNMWDFLCEKKKCGDFEIDSSKSKEISLDVTSVGSYIQPFSGGPHSAVPVMKNVFLQLINQCKKYVYISTPYLILDDETSGALATAARSGLDVRIIVPHIPDKKFVFRSTRSNYLPLIEAGVRIFEFAPGFNHSKTVVSDGVSAYFGSCNLDYRSFYVQYECGALLYNDPVIGDIEKDFKKTLESCLEISYEAALKYRHPLTTLISPLF